MGANRFDRRALLGLAAVAGTGLLIGCAKDEPPVDGPALPSPSSSGSAPATPPPTVNAPDLTPPAAGALQIPERSWSLETRGGKEILSYGVVVENIGDRVAYLNSFEIRFVGRDGEDVIPAESVFLKAEVTVVLPGERVGFGNTFAAPASGVSRMDVEVATKEWWAPVNSVHAFAPITVGEVATDRSSPPKKLMFAVDSAYGMVLPSTRATALFRDKEGKIVGGATAPEPSALPSGRSEGAFTVEHGLPKAADAASTEVFVPILL
ncbi:hypothetical protein AB0I28_06100 [Phytomonospora sp. NPDC050363]|uniref:hypothetical protein n=1 Tax=Phytomonospora sp. NPDC050363 TaxID=3155642 RepID=UPI0033D55218